MAKLAEEWMWMKGKKFLIYARQSSKQQSGIPSQIKECEAWLKEKGIRSKPKIYKEVVSGAKGIGERKELSAMISMILSSPVPSDYVILMRDFTRWSRMLIDGIADYKPLYDYGVTLIACNSNMESGTRKRPSPEGVFQFGLSSSLGTLEWDQKRKQSIKGTERATVAGIQSGRFLDLDKPWRFTAENLYRRLLEKDDPMRLGQKSFAKASGASLGWFKKAEVRLNKVIDYGIANNIDNALEQYIQELEYLRTVREKYGRGSLEFKATRYMMSGFIMAPERFWSFKPNDQRKAEFILTPKEFLPKDKW